MGAGPLTIQLSMTSCHFQDPRATSGNVLALKPMSLALPTHVCKCAPHLRAPCALLCGVRHGLSFLSSQTVSTGGGGHVQLLRRAVAQLTYCSLCPPDDLADRGLLGIPGALYAHDALRLWGIIAR